MPSGELRIRVTPRSSRNKIDASGDPVKVWVTASPTDGQANEAVCKLLASALDIPPSSVSVSRGHSSREKTLVVEGLDTATIRANLAPPPGESL